MARVMCIDYGKKRCGIAVTDPLQIIASSLDTIYTSALFQFLKNYFLQEEVERVVVGLPFNLDGGDTHATPLVQEFIGAFAKKYPGIPVETMDEAFTSKMASRALVDSGVNKKKRQQKGMLDKMAATIMLQEWLEKSRS